MNRIPFIEQTLIYLTNIFYITCPDAHKQKNMFLGLIIQMSELSSEKVNSFSPWYLNFGRH